MKLRSWIWVGAMVAASPAGADAGGAFRDWSMSCTPGLSCTAATFAPNGSAVSSLSLKREAAEGARVVLGLGFGEETKVAGTTTLSVDGGMPFALPMSAFAADEYGNVDASEPGIGDELLPTLRNGREVTVSTETDRGTLSQSFSLAGLVATLRKMDEDQARIGTRSALIDRGDKPLPDRSILPSDVATADALPPSVRRLWETDGGCADFGDSGPVGDLGFSAPVGPEARLFVLACGLPGAYNYPSHLYMHYPSGDSAEPVPLPRMSADGPVAELGAWNVDLTGDRLVSFFKGRGIGDCGQYNEWRIDPELGGLRLVESREKDECDGDGGEGPQSWPLFWPKG